ncbi:PspC domain-containing protein, partial [Arthrobacter sp. EH-1B-1]
MRPPLLRSDDALIAGVCGGLAAHLGVSLRVARISMVALSLVGGAGVVLYGWLWLLVPTTEERRRGVATPAGLRLGAPVLAGPGSKPPRSFGAAGSREVMIGVGLL